MKPAALLVLILIAPVAGCFAGGKPLPPPQYSPVSIPGEETTGVADINNSEEMVGNYSSGYPDEGCFAIINGTVYKFTLGTTTTPSCTGVNSNGDIVGQYHPTPATTMGFVIKNRKRFDVSPPNSGFSAAYAINDLGQIVGLFQDNLGTHGFLYDGANYQQIDAPGATFTAAYGINNQGQITLQWGDGQNTYSSIYDGSTYTPVSVPGAFSTQVRQINNLGDIAILWEDSKQNPHGAVLKNGKYYILGYPGGGTTAPLGINDQDIIVGYAEGTAYSGSFKLIP